MDARREYYLCKMYYIYANINEKVNIQWGLRMLMVEIGVPARQRCAFNYEYFFYDKLLLLEIFGKEIKFFFYDGIFDLGINGMIIGEYL